MNQEKIQKHNQTGIKVIGIIFIILAVLILLGGLISGDIISIVQGIIIILMGILLIRLKKWGLYIMGLLFLGTIAQLSTNIAQGLGLLEIIIVIIFAVVFVYTWSQRKFLN